MNEDDKNELSKTVWAPSKVCDQTCDFCFGYEKETIYTLDTYFEMVDKLRELGANKFIWSGGEPLRFQLLDSLIDYASDQNIQNVVVTNGRRLTQKRLENFEGKADEIRISIHSLDPELNRRHKISKAHEKNGEYEKLILRNLNSVKGHDMRLAISTVYLGQKEIDLINMAEQFAEAGVNEWTFQELVNIRGAAKSAPGICTTDHILNVINKLNDMGYPLRIVLNSAKRLSNEYDIVDPEGQLNCVRDGKDIVVGNVATSSVGILRKGLRKMSYEKDC